MSTPTCIVYRSVCGARRTGQQVKYFERRSGREERGREEAEGGGVGRVIL